MSFLSELSGIKPRYEVRYRESIINRYAEPRGNVNNRPTFSQLWQCYAWAAVLGFIHDRRRAFDSPTDAAFPFGTITNNGPLVAKALICAALAKADTGIEVLRTPKEIITLIEEYANGGFDYISETLDQKGKFHFDDFNNMLIEVRDRG